MIEMKRKDTVEGVSSKLNVYELNGKTFFKGLGAKLSIVIAGVLTVGAISMTALADFEGITSVDANTEITTTTTQTNSTTGATTVSATTSWCKAEASKNDLTQTEEVTELVTTVTEASSENATTVKKERNAVRETATVAVKTKSAAIKEIKAAKTDNKKTKVKSVDKKTITMVIDDLYAQEDVNLRKQASTSSDVIKVVKRGTKVYVTGKEKNGFYLVKVGKKSGYIMASYLGSKPSNVTTTEESSSKEYIGTYKITAYSASSSARTASGTKCQSGRTIAAPSNFPFGTKLMFNGNVYTVEDRGGAVTGNVLDLYVDSNSEAVQWGVKYLKVYKVNN